MTFPPTTWGWSVPEHSLGRRATAQHSPAGLLAPGSSLLPRLPIHSGQWLQRQANRLQWRLRSGIKPLSLFTSVYRTRRAGWPFDFGEMLSRHAQFVKRLRPYQAAHRPPVRHWSTLVASGCGSNESYEKSILQNCLLTILKSRPKLLGIALRWRSTHSATFNKLIDPPGAPVSAKKGKAVRIRHGCATVIRHTMKSDAGKSGNLPGWRCSASAQNREALWR